MGETFIIMKFDFLNIVFNKLTHSTQNLLEMPTLTRLIPSICKKHEYRNFVYRVNSNDEPVYDADIFGKVFNMAVKMEVFCQDGGYVVTRVWCNYSDYCWTCIGFAKTEAERDKLMTIGKLSQLVGNILRAGEVAVGVSSLGIWTTVSHRIKAINQTLLNLSSEHDGCRYTYGYT